MKITKQLVANLIVEAIKDKKSKKEEVKPAKSSGKLLDLKKDLRTLEQMRSDLDLVKFTEQSEGVKFVKEYNSIKSKVDELKNKIDNEISTLKTKIQDATHKIKEFMGLPSNQDQNDK